MNPLSNARAKPDQAIEFFKVWFGSVPPESLVSIVRIHPGSPRVRTLVLPLQDILGALEESGLDDLIWDDGTFFDLYFGVSTLSTPPEEGKRGGLKDVKDVPGVWIDLDVKSGAFENEQQALDLLYSLPLAPTAVVSTGLGGLHGYWKLRRPVTCEEGRRLALQWWALISERAGTRAVDRLCDPSRVLRIPGAIRWPKTTDTGTPQVSCSELLSCNNVSYLKSEIDEASEEAWAVHEVRYAEVRKTASDARIVTEAMLQRKYQSNKWLKAVSVLEFEERFNEKYSWDSLLIPLGWTKLREDDEGRVFWSRPGDGVRKSATTDWPESPHIMSLFSTSSETGLADLHHSNVMLSKYRVWVHLYWNDDEASALESVIDQL